MIDNLTPLEKIEQSRVKTAVFRATLIACQDLIEVSKELAEIVDDGEAKKELSLTDHALVALATTLEERFGISA